MPDEHKFDNLKGTRTISLTTYYTNGKTVAIPIDSVLSEDKLYVSTRKDSYKVKIAYSSLPYSYRKI